MSAPLLEVRGLVKDFQQLRPLRVRALIVAPGEIISLAGLDALAAEMFVHLVTGASLPDEGDIALFGGNTRTIPDTASWLQSLEGLGLVGARAVLLNGLSVLQNVAIPHTLAIEPIDPEHRPTVDAIAREVGLDEGVWETALGTAGPEVQFRVRLARALALSPSLIIAEHPSADLPREAVARVAADCRRIALARNLAFVALTADPEFARGLGGRSLTIRPATGEVAAAGGFVERFRRVLGSG